MKVDKSCRIGRDYECYQTFLTDNPDIPITQLDSVEGKKGGKVLLTIHFVKAEMMLAFFREQNDSKSVITIFDALYQILGPDNFTKLFKVCLADNGSKFSNPLANFIPKGTDLGLYTQADINRMMDHINSYGRGSIGNKSPYEMFAFFYGNDILDLLECHRIPPQEVTLNKSIFDKGVSQ